MKALRLATSWLFVLSFPLLLLSSTLLLMVGGTHLYEYGFSKYEASRVTGLEKSELIKAAKGLICYFNGEKGFPQIQVMRGSRETELFTEREIDHLRDVKRLIDLFRLIKWGTLGYAIIYVIGGFTVRRWAFLTSISRAILSGSVFTLVLFSLLGIWAVVDFQDLFLRFHLVSFQNELWILDPSRHYLVMMFPEAFFHDAALFLFGGVMLEAVVLGGISFFSRSRAHQRG